MVGTELLFVLILFIVCATPDCTPDKHKPEYATCSGHSLDSLINMGGDFRIISVNNPPNAAFVVDKSKNQYVPVITTLDLSSNKALIIYEYGFKDFVSLYKLNLKNCSIEAVKGTWFLVNNDIAHFDCSHNKLRTLAKSDLENLKKLFVANFSHNLLESIEPHAFSEMKELWKLNLEGNKLISIPTGSLPMLYLINLSDNLIEIVPENVFTDMPKITWIYLQHNAIRKIEDEAFKDLNHLSEIDLSNNFIEEITEFTFAGLSETSLIRLDFSSNKIRRIAPGAFKEVIFIRTLDLSNNSINELNENTFEGLDTEILLLDHNEIELVGSNTFRGLTKLKKLFISANKLRSLTADTFGTSLPNLQVLVIAYNNILQLDSDMFKFTPNIVSLDISSNNIQVLPEDIFIPLTKLKTLHMQHNFIEELTGAHIESLKSLKHLFIDHNKLTFIPLNRDSFPKLKEMTIGGNPWQCACLDEVQDFLNEKNIEFLKEYYFDGQCPVCVPTYFEHCDKNIAFARFENIVETYKNTNTEQCRTKYLREQQRYELSFLSFVF